MCIRDSLTGVRVVRAFGRESYSMDQFQAQNAELSRRWIKVGDLLAIYWSCPLYTSGQNQ